MNTMTEQQKEEIQELIMTHVSNNIKKIRFRLDMNQKQFAKHIHLTPTQLGGYEQKQFMPSAITLLYLSKVSGKTINELLTQS